MKKLLSIVTTLITSAAIVAVPLAVSADDTRFDSLVVDMDGNRQGLRDITITFTMGDEGLNGDNATTPDIYFDNEVTTTAKRSASATEILFEDDAYVELGDKLAEQASFGGFIGSFISLNFSGVLDAGETYSFTVYNATVKPNAGGYGFYTFYVSNETALIADIEDWHVSQNTLKTRNTDYGNDNFKKPTVKNIDAANATVEWDRATYQNAVTNFRVQVKNKATGDVTTYKNVKRTKRSKNLKELKSGTKYWVRVKANYASGDSTKWSKKRSFKTSDRSL